MPYLADLGVTALELMPVAEFPGTFGWSYDGVDLFAPFHGYGTPDDFRRFVDRAHGLGLAVLLDVVYNHLGPDGNYLKSFSDDYFSKRHKTEWGEALNFDGENAGAGARVRPRQRRLLGRRVPCRRPACRCDAEHLRRGTRPHPRGDRADDRARRPGAVVCWSSARTRPRVRGCSGLPSEAVSGSTCSGATTSTTP